MKLVTPEVGNFTLTFVSLMCFVSREDETSNPSFLLKDLYTGVLHQTQPPPVCIAASERNAEHLDCDIEPSVCLFLTYIMPAPFLRIVVMTRGGFLSGLFLTDMERGASIQIINEHKGPSLHIDSAFYVLV